MLCPRLRVEERTRPATTELSVVGGGGGARAEHIGAPGRSRLVAQLRDAAQSAVQRGARGPGARAPDAALSGRVHQPEPAPRHAVLASCAFYHSFSGNSVHFLNST